MAYIVRKRPSKCSSSELDAFEGLVKKGGEVAFQGLRGRIKKAEWLVFLFQKEGLLAGVAALKRQSDAYKRKVFRKAESREIADDFTFEAGWIVVEERFRGKKYSRRLLNAVLRLAGKQKVYATTREDNEPMRRTNRHCRLKESGIPYQSERGNYSVVLYTWEPGR